MSHPTPESDAPRVAAEYIYLIVAIVTAIVTLAVWLVDMATPGDDVPRGIYDALRVLTILSGCGYLVRSAASKLERSLDEQRRQGYAAGFVDGMTGHGEDSATVRSIRGR